jgi:hypothetical protein
MTFVHCKRIQKFTKMTAARASGHKHAHRQSVQYTIKIQHQVL